MTQDKESRGYTIGGELSAKEWRGVEGFMGRLGLNMKRLAPEEVTATFGNTLSERALSKREFHDTAIEHGFRPGVAAGTWNKMACVYFWQEAKWCHVPEPFRDILQYETVLDGASFRQFGERVDGLKMHSFGRFIYVADRAIQEAGSINKAALPSGFGPATMDLLHAVGQDSRMTNE